VNYTDSIRQCLLAVIFVCNEGMKKFKLVFRNYISETDGQIYVY